MKNMVDRIPTIGENPKKVPNHQPGNLSFVMTMGMLNDH